MKQNILFETKEESNKRRNLAALSRTPHERFIFFLQLCDEMQFFETKQPHPNHKKNNFIVQ